MSYRLLGADPGMWLHLDRLNLHYSRKLLLEPQRRCDKPDRSIAAMPLKTVSISQAGVIREDTEESEKVL